MECFRFRFRICEWIDVAANRPFHNVDQDKHLLNTKVAASRFVSVVSYVA